MEFAVRHRWDLEIPEAIALQTELASEVDVSVPLGPLETLAAADVSYDWGSDVLFASVIVVKVETREVVETVGERSVVTFPYVPGLLSFREAPPLLEAFAKLQTRPDAVLVDGQGIAHPRRLGIGSHLGLWLGIPTIGCAKSRLCGRYREPGPKRGDWSPLIDKEETVGAVLRTKAKVKPLYVSPGHLCDQDEAIRAVLACQDKYRLPTPARLAHLEVNRLRREAALPPEAE